MMLRARDKRVTFTRPFVLKGLEGVQPSGTYSVENRDVHAGLLSSRKAKRTSTWIRVCLNPGTAGIVQIVNIDPLDLAAALTRDSLPA
jgi:hypothetical protein